jgi:hypothetical protein
MKGSDLALEQLETAVKPPGSPSNGDLRLNPMWNPLRGDSRFENRRLPRAEVKSEVAGVPPASLAPTSNQPTRLPLQSCGKRSEIGDQR